MRIPRTIILCESDLAQQFRYAGAPVSGRKHAVDVERFLYLDAYSETPVHRAERVLVNHLHPGALLAPELRLTI